MAARKVNKTDPRNVAKPVSQLRGAAKQARIAKVTKAEAGPATVRGGMAPGAGRSKPIGTGGGGVTKPSGTAKMVNADSPTMRQIRAKAQTLRNRTQNPTPRGQGSATRLPNSSAQGRNLPREGATRLRQQTAGTLSPGATARAQARGLAEAAKAQARRGARAASQNMSRTLQNAKVARSAGGLLGRAAVPLAIVQEVTSMVDREKRMQALRKQGIERRAKAAAAKQGNTSKFANARTAAISKAKAIKGSPVLGPKKSSAQQFDQAFKAARTSGAKQFTWRGKRYTTKMKGE